MIIIGDTNVNLLRDSASSKKYIDMLLSNGYAPLNKISDKFATRTASRNINGGVITTNTIIDHVISDCVEFSFKLSLIDCPLSDHKEITLAIDNNK